MGLEKQDLNDLQERLHLRHYLRLEQIIMLRPPHDRHEAVAQMLEYLGQHHLLPDIVATRLTLMEKERYVSTTLGKSIAVIHAKVSHNSHPLVALGLERSGISWGAKDGDPVKVILLLLGDGSLHHLKLLGELTHWIYQEPVRQILLQARDGNEVLRLLDHLNRPEQ